MCPVVDLCSWEITLFISVQRSSSLKQQPCFVFCFLFLGGRGGVNLSVCHGSVVLVSFEYSIYIRLAFEQRAVMKTGLTTHLFQFHTLIFTASTLSQKPQYYHSFTAGPVGHQHLMPKLPSSAMHEMLCLLPLWSQSDSAIRSLSRAIWAVFDAIKGSMHQ